MKVWSNRREVGCWALEKACGPRVFRGTLRSGECSACSKSLGVNILVWMSEPFLKVPGGDGKLKTNMSVSIWNLIYCWVLKFRVKNSFLMVLIMLCHTPVFLVQLSVLNWVLCSGHWFGLPDGEPPTDGWSMRYFLWSGQITRNFQG